MANFKVWPCDSALWPQVSRLTKTYRCCRLCSLHSPRRGLLLAVRAVALLSLSAPLPIPDFHGFYFIFIFSPIIPSVVTRYWIPAVFRIRVYQNRISSKKSSLGVNGASVYTQWGFIHISNDIAYCYIGQNTRSFYILWLCQTLVASKRPIKKVDAWFEVARFWPEIRTT